mgnify:CR=1 FL=1
MDKEDIQMELKNFIFVLGVLLVFSLSQASALFSLQVEGEPELGAVITFKIKTNSYNSNDVSNDGRLFVST